jgi:hypothetical protein
MPSNGRPLEEEIIVIQKLISIASLIKEMSGRNTSAILHIAFIKELYAQEVMTSTILVKKFSTVLIDKVKYGYTLSVDIFPSGVSSKILYIPFYFLVGFIIKKTNGIRHIP